MERVIANGVPYFTDKQTRLYTWDTEATPQLIGTYNPTADTVAYESNHLDKLTERLQDWRTKQQPRDRKATTNGRRNPRGKASKPSADSEGDE